MRAQLGGVNTDPETEFSPFLVKDHLAAFKGVVCQAGHIQNELQVWGSRGAPVVRPQQGTCLLIPTGMKQHLWVGDGHIIRVQENHLHVINTRLAQTYALHPCCACGNTCSPGTSREAYSTVRKRCAGCTTADTHHIRATFELCSTRHFTPGICWLVRMLDM